MTHSEGHTDQMSNQLAVAGSLAVSDELLREHPELVQALELERAAVAEVVPSDLLALTDDPAEALPVRKLIDFVDTVAANPRADFVVRIASGIQKASRREHDASDVLDQSFKFQALESTTDYGGHTGSLTPNDLWAKDETELQQKIEQEAALEQAKKTFIDTHPMGEGAVILTNRYGGIDPTNPAATAKSILMRIAAVDQAGLLNEQTPLSLYVNLGLLDKRIAQFAGGQWTRMVEKLYPVIQTLKQLPESTPPEARAAIAGLAQEHVNTFLETTHERLWLAATMLKHPKNASAIISALMSTDETFKEAMQPTIENHRKR